MIDIEKAPHMLEQTPELKREYEQEQSERLHRVNRIAALAGFLIVAYLTCFSDPVNFPAYYELMFRGRLYALVLAPIVLIGAFIPAFRNRGYLFSTLLFVGGTMMMAHLTAVMNNESSAVVAWLFISIIYCGIYPLPILHSVAVVIASLAYYQAIYFSMGFEADLDFRMTLVNVGSASFFSLAFKLAFSRIRKREFYFRKGLTRANQEIADLNEKLKDENIRLVQELEVARHIQTLVLPQKYEYSSFDDLEIACRMITAEEVGGDYYDTINFTDGGIISIGDVTDHGLHSGLIMMMVHTALRALSQLERDDIREIYRIINKLLYDFRLKTSDTRIMTLLILRYLGDGRFTMTGQHENLLIISAKGAVKEISTLEYGMFAGLEKDVDSYLDVLSFTIEDGDVLILYTDGITEAQNAEGLEFGTQGITEAALPLRGRNVEIVKEGIMRSCLAHIGKQQIHDDLSVVVIKKTGTGTEK